jgi:hypothetical protein
MQLFGLLTILGLVLAWANNEFVMTKEVLLALAGDPQNTAQVELQYETVQRMQVWGYVMAPFQTAFRIGLVGLVVQLMCLLGGIDIGFRKVFRISSVAFGAQLFGSFLQVIWIVRQPTTAITRASLGIVPDSLAAWFGTANEAPSLLYLVLSRASITSMMWMLLLYWGLRETNQIRPVGAAAATIGTWLAVGTLQVATSLFVRGLVG